MRHPQCSKWRITDCWLLLTTIAIAMVMSLPMRAKGAERSPHGSYAVVTANPVATSAAAQILQNGGSAADAAITAQLVLGVVEPQSSGIGGGAVLLYREAAQGPVRAFDGLARAPSAYDPQSFSAKGFSHSGAAVGVPGAVRLMAMLHARYGKLPWSALFEPAIQIASSGFTVPPYLGQSLAAAVRVGFAPPAWLQDRHGAPLPVGAVVRNEQLAATMHEIARDGANAFYIHSAPEIVAAVRGSFVPGFMKEDDIKNYVAVERAPLCASFRQMRVCAFPPPSYGGVAVLEMLELLDRFHVGTPNFLAARFVHAFVEAGRIAEADRFGSIGDPDLVPVSTAALLNRDHIKEWADLFDPSHTMKVPSPISESGDASCAKGARSPSPSTTQIAIVDKWGAALSMTTTINVNFGAWLPVRGFFLNNAMTNFTMPSDSRCAANRPEGDKRPETSMVPVIVTDKAGRTVLLGGSAGGGEIVDYVAQTLLTLIYGRSPLESLDAGHVSTARSPYPDSLGVVEVEEGRGIASLAAQLEALGHPVKVVPLQSGLGFLERQPKGSWLGAADPRRDGIWLTGE